ncbi:protein POOR HOMOLOGOUS SYNAPSIS 1-like isoform X2 [Silene latifolia]|uniref:protein POOR HOMOLOGOUS SYNAPSIS 1-like isoform X2 n=1 Tax=Silene latifolia TaxID=37657 RepID=UPI003D76DB51
MKLGSWDVEYAKFFTFPISSSSSTSSSLLRPLCCGAKQRLKGIWVPCSSPDAVVDIFAHNNSPFPCQPTLVVSLHGIAFEEHYVSALNFIWPQGDRLSESSKRGCKVIFACYRDKMGQIQKFAMRFSSSDECQEYMEVLKCLKNGSEIDVPGAMQSNFLIEGERINTRQSAPAPEIADVALPDSFTALLAGCFTTTDPGVPQASPEIDLKGFLSAGSKTDKPFLDLLEKLDNIVVGLGGDLRF